MTKLELPNGNYRLTKTKAINSGGFITTGRTEYITDFTPEVQVGDRFWFAVGFKGITTSPVTSFKIIPGNKLEIYTENSIYFLEEMY